MSGPDGTDETNDRISHFGTVTASLSHELGNALAAALETAGLVADWVDAAGDGRALDPVRVGGAMGRIERSVNRGLEFVQLLNWIAHSIDAAGERPLLQVVVDRAVDSARYFARNRNVSIEVAGDPGDVAVRCRAFESHLLLFSCLRLAIDDAAAGARITAHPECGAAGSRVRFSVSELREGWSLEPDERNRVASLAAASGCGLEGSSTPDGEEHLLLRFPGERSGGSQGESQEESQKES